MEQDGKYEKIYKKLVNIFEELFNIVIERNDNDYLDIELIGKDYNLAARDLVFLFFNIEKEFGIYIPEEEVVAGRFNTFNNIAEIITNQLEKIDKEVAG